MTSARPAILWFRRDLRLHDHPALAAALAQGGPVLPVYVLDRRLLAGRWPSANRAAFLAGSLRALDGELRARGSRLHLVEGRPERVIPTLASAIGAAAVFWSRDYAPFGRRRDAAVRAALADAGVAAHEAPGLLASEPEELLTGAGTPFRVFTPFLRAWESLPKRSPLPAPERMATPGSFDSLPIPAPGDFAPTASGLPAPGEAAARTRLGRFAAGPLARYAHDRDSPALDGSSRLSQDLRWGLLSPAEVFALTASGGEGPARFRAEIAWRDFYAHLLWHFPSLLREPMQPRYATVRWSGDRAALAAWKAGATGYPIVDAAMRQLSATGWMHNRLRMITASFLTKDLLVDWREGERYFMEHLTDGDAASNNGGWQWAASVGADAQPYFRVFNPVLQGQRFDPDGAFVRRWLPALAEVPTAHIHAPWTMPGAVQRAAGCVVGRDYPAPIVDHREARLRAIAAYRSAAGEEPVQPPTEQLRMPFDPT